MASDLHHAARFGALVAIDAYDSMRESGVVSRPATPPPAPRDYQRFGGYSRLPAAGRVPVVLDDGLSAIELEAELYAADLRYADALHQVRSVVEANRPSVPLRKRGRVAQ
jgi:hypothetical protein